MCKLEPVLCPSLSTCWPGFWSLRGWASSFSTSFYISQIVYVLLFHNRYQHFFLHLGYLQTLLSLLFPAGFDIFFPHLPSRLRQELLQHMKHLVPTIWLLLDWSKFPRPETYLRVTGIKHQLLVIPPDTSQGCLQSIVKPYPILPFPGLHLKTPHPPHLTQNLDHRNKLSF